MSVERIDKDLVAALKAGEKSKAGALRLLKSALVYARIAKGQALNNDEFEKVVRKEMKLRVEARDMFRNNDRPAQADQEELERAVYAEYVPAELTDDAIADLANSTIATLGAQANFGQIMQAVMNQVAGRADGKRVSEIIKNKLGKP